MGLDRFHRRNKGKWEGKGMTWTTGAYEPLIIGQEEYKVICVGNSV